MNPRYSGPQPDALGLWATPTMRNLLIITERPPILQWVRLLVCLLFSFLPHPLCPLLQTRILIEAGNIKFGEGGFCLKGACAPFSGNPFLRNRDNEQYCFIEDLSVFGYLLGGLILHMLSLTGIILIWNMRRTGYLVFGVSSLIISGYQLFASQISPLTTAVYIALVILFGVFMKKLR